MRRPAILEHLDILLGDEIIIVDLQPFSRQVLVVAKGICEGVLVYRVYIHWIAFGGVHGFVEGGRGGWCIDLIGGGGDSR